MSFASDALFDGRRLRALMVVDAFTRQASAIAVDQGIKGEQVVAAVTRSALPRGASRAIQVDNGPGFVSKALDRWAYENSVTLDFSRPVEPTDNALVESFNGRLRDECLNANWFLSFADAKIKPWWRPYNESRPHTALGVADAPGIRLGGDPAGRRMRPGGSAFGRTKSGDPHQAQKPYLRSDQCPSPQGRIVRIYGYFSNADMGLKRPAAWV